MVEVEVLFDYTSEHDDELTIKKGDLIKNVAQMTGGWWEGDLNGKRGMFPDNFVKVVGKDAKQSSRPPSVTGSNVNLRKGEKKRKCKVLFSYQPENDDELRLEVNDIIDVLEEVEEGWWSGSVRGKTGVFPSNFVEEVPLTDAEKVTPPQQTQQQQQPQAQQPPQPPEKLVNPEVDEIKPRPVKGIGYGNIFQDGMVKLKPAAGASSQEPKNVVPPKKPPFPNIPPTMDAPQLPPKPVREQAKVLYSYDAQNDDELSLKEGDIITIISKDAEDAGWWKGELSGRVGVFPDNFVELIVDDGKVKKPERSEKLTTSLKLPLKHERDLPDGTTASKDSSSHHKDALPPFSNKEPESSVVKGSHIKKFPPDSKKEDKAEKHEKHGPPLPNKKPHLPPPLKKVSHLSATFGPTVSNVSPSHHPTPPVTAVATDTNVADTKVKPPQIVKQDNNSNDMNFDGVESSEKLVHLTANRARIPKRRPPSHVFLKGDNEKSNGDIENEVTNPWKQELKKNQLKRRSHANHDLHVTQETLLEVEEKRLSLAKPLEDENSNSKLVSGNINKPSSISSASRLKPNDSTDEKDHKVEKSTISEVTVEKPALSADPTLSELVKLYHVLREDMVSKAELRELKNEHTELQTAFETYKALTIRTITELSREIQLENNLRQALEKEVEKLKSLLNNK